MKRVRNESDDSDSPHLGLFMTDRFSHKIHGGELVNFCSRPHHMAASSCNVKEIRSLSDARFFP